MINNSVTKRDITEGVLLFVNFVVLTTFRYMGRAGFITLFGFLMMFGMTVYWICGIKKFSMNENGEIGGTPAVMFGLSVIYKMLIMTSAVFQYWNSFGDRPGFGSVYYIIYIVGKLLILVFVFICLYKKAYKEVVVALIYDFYAAFFVPCSMIPLNH